MHGLPWISLAQLYHQSFSNSTQPKTTTMHGKPFRRLSTHSIMLPFFVIKATEKYGSKGHEQAERLIKEVSGLYAGGELAEEDMEAMMRAFQEAYWKAKEKNRKYVPKKYRGISESGSES